MDSSKKKGKKKGKDIELECAIGLLDYYYNEEEKFEWYLLGLDVISQLKTANKNKRDENEIDILIVGFSPQKVMISLSEVKSGKHKKFQSQLENQRKLLEQLKSKFEIDGYRTRILDSFRPKIKETTDYCSQQNIKTQAIYLYIDSEKNQKIAKV